VALAEIGFEEASWTRPDSSSNPVSG